MNTDWNTFLQQAGAVIVTTATDSRVHDFGQPVHELQALDSSDILADVSHTGLIAVQGADAASFLQGQLTNDIREVSATDTTTAYSQISAYCSPKGRMLACMRIFMRDDTYYLSLPREILDATLQRLRLFVLRARVTLNDVSDTLVYAGYAGAHAAATLTAILGTVPANINDVTHINGLTLLRLPHRDAHAARFGIIGDAAAVQALWTALRAPRRDAQERPSAQPVGANVWDLLDIRAGIPTVYAATRDTFVPQMANLDTLGGISFKKGCYTGQEIVARMHYLGTLKRRMVLAKITGATPHGDASVPQPGDALYASGIDDAQGRAPAKGSASVGRSQHPASGDTSASLHVAGERSEGFRMPGATNPQSIGTIVAAQPAPHREYEALAIVDIKSAETGQIHLRQVTGPTLTLIPLPYAHE